MREYEAGKTSPKYSIGRCRRSREQGRDEDEDDDLRRLRGSEALEDAVAMRTVRLCAAESQIVTGLFDDDQTIIQIAVTSHLSVNPNFYLQVAFYSAAAGQSKSRPRCGEEVVVR